MTQSNGTSDMIWAGDQEGVCLAEVWIRSQGEEEENNGTPREVDGRAVNCWGDTDTLQEATIRHGAAGLHLHPKWHTVNMCQKITHHQPQTPKGAKGSSGSKHFTGRKAGYFTRISFVLLQKGAVVVPRQASNIHLGGTCWLPSSSEGWASLGHPHTLPHVPIPDGISPWDTIGLRVLACAQCGSQKAAASRI